MPEVLNWPRTTDSRKVVHSAVRALAAGHLVAFPTETVYGIAASALLPVAVERLRQCKGRPEDKPLTLAIGGTEEALDWVPGMSVLGRRLARRCWPGPVTLVFAQGVETGLVSRLPDLVRERVSPEGTVGLRSPAHEAIRQVLRLLPGPLALTSANLSGEPEATTARDVVQAVGSHVRLVLDDGPSRYGRASTVVRVNGNTWQVLREGVVAPATLERLACCIMVFVCTGNTCRSPLAEALCKKLLAERLNCTPEELPRRGFIVLSAGLAAIVGARAAEEASTAARDLGADLTGHSSQPLTPQLAAQADQLIVMTRGHLHALGQQFPHLPCQARLLCPDGDDIPDPVGGDEQVYRECAQQILRHLKRIVPEVQQV